MRNCGCVAVTLRFQWIEYLTIFLHVLWYLRTLYLVWSLVRRRVTRVAVAVRLRFFLIYLKPVLKPGLMYWLFCCHGRNGFPAVILDLSKSSSCIISMLCMLSCDYYLLMLFLEFENGKSLRPVIKYVDLWCSLTGVLVWIHLSSRNVKHFGCSNNTDAVLWITLKPFGVPVKTLNLKIYIIFGVF